MQRRTHKRRSQVNSYPGTHQFEPNIKDSQKSSPCEQWIMSSGPIKSGAR